MSSVLSAPALSARARDRAATEVLRKNGWTFAVVAVLAIALPFTLDVSPSRRLLLLGLAVLAAAVLLAALVPWPRLPGSASLAVPLVVLGAIGIMSMAGLRVALIAVLPVVTMALSNGRLGLVLGVVGATVVSWADQFTQPTGITPDNVARLVILPIVVLIVAATVWAVEERSSARASLLSRQGTELRGVVEELRSERGLVAAVLRSLTAGVVVIDDAARVALLNPVIAQLVGRAISVGDDLCRVDQQPGATDAVVRIADYARRARDGVEVTGETRWWRMDDGAAVALRATVVPFLTRSGGGAHHVLIFEDLTAEEAANSNRELFVNGISHELRTPLTSIIGHLEISLDDPDLSAPTRRSLGVAERNAGRLLHLVNDLLTAAAMSSGSFTLMRGPLDLGEVVSDAISGIEPRATATGVVVEQYGDGPSVVSGDRAALAQVLDNLLSNAVKYSESGGLVRVILEREDDAVVLRVIDQGIGISARDRAKLFERFFRANAVRESVREGTGLGLAITKEIVAEHGGTIEVRSGLGVGTTVEVRLPGLQPEPEPQTQPQPGQADR